MIILENEYLKVEVTTAGAEIRHVEGKQTGISYMWEGDSTYWGRVAPVLFPIVGRLKNDRYTLDGKVYRMPQHGFLRDVEFSVEERTEQYAVFSFDSSDAFLDVYPFEFQAVIHYTLEELTLRVRWEIKNKQSETMLFSIGGHPAFKVPMLKNESPESYELSFTPAEGKTVTQYELEDSLAHEKQVLKTIEPMPVRASLFEKDALIYSNIDRVSLLSPQTGHGVEVNLTGFPFVGIWSSYNPSTSAIAPFVCIEPWYGIADTVDTTGDLENKKGIQKLEAGGRFQAEYGIAFK